jgi:zinc protease
MNIPAIGIDNKVLQYTSGAADGSVTKLVPNLHFVTPLNDKVYYGTGISVPFGLAVDYAGDSSAAAYATTSSLQVINWSQDLAYAFNNRFSIGFGLDVQRYDGEFDANILDREKQRSIASIRESMTQPQSIATKALWQSMYPNHPYGKSSTPESIAAITADDLARFHQTYWQPQRMRITIVGALSEAEARELVERLMIYSPKQAAVPLRPSMQKPGPAVSTQSSGISLKRQAIPHPATQSHVWMGLPALARDDPDFFAITVGNYILGGGGFVSRLTEEIREKRGLSYSVFSAFQPLVQPGPFLIGLQTQNAKAPQALSVVEDTLRRFLRDGPTEKELRAAKQNLVGGFALRVDSNRKLLDNLAQINYYDLPLDYLQTWTKKVSAVSAADIRKAMSRVVQLDRLSVVVVAGSEGFTP